MFGFRVRSAVSTDPHKIDEVLTRAVEEVIDKEDLRRQLSSGKVLRIKLGIDPTSPHLHLGRSIPLLKLRDFQNLGHSVVFIVGDATGVVGDTSDKESERPMLTQKQVQENLKSYLSQIGKILDVKRTEVRYNSSWLLKLSYQEIGEQADRFSVSDFIARENIKKRLDGGSRVSLREVLYPLMQGYDSVAVRADVELGGTDQRFNLLAGRTLQGYYHQRPQNILTNPLLEGLDGRKMSSSWGNTINLTDTPSDMYGKTMSLRDDLVVRYFTLCTRLPMEEVEEIKQKLTLGELHPKEAKKLLAKTIVAMYHSVEDAEKSEGEFEKVFSRREIPSEMPVVYGSVGTPLSELFRRAEVVASNSEFQRLVEAGAIEDEKGSKVLDPKTTVQGDIVYKIGKRRFVRVYVK